MLIGTFLLTDRLLLGESCQGVDETVQHERLTREVVLAVVGDLQLALVRLDCQFETSWTTLAASRDRPNVTILKTLQSLHDPGDGTIVLAFQGAEVHR